MAVWTAVECSRTRSNAALISIARGEGSGDVGVGEGGLDAPESEVCEPSEWIGRWLMDASEGHRRDGWIDRLGDSLIAGMGVLRVVQAEARQEVNHSRK